MFCNYLQDMFIAHHKKKSQTALIQYNLNDYRFIGIVYGGRNDAVAISSSVYEHLWNFMTLGTKSNHCENAIIVNGH